MTKHCTSCCETSAVTSEMLLGVEGARKAAKVATEIVGLSLHGSVFTACAIIIQLCVAKGEPLFEMEYGDD
jgi:hypothetical protein